MTSASGQLPRLLIKNTDRRTDQVIVPAWNLPRGPREINRARWILNLGDRPGRDMDTFRLRLRVLATPKLNYRRTHGMEPTEAYGIDRETGKSVLRLLINTKPSNGEIHQRIITDKLDAATFADESFSNDLTTRTFEFRAWSFALENLQLYNFYNVECQFNFSLPTRF